MSDDPTFRRRRRRRRFLFLLLLLLVAFGEETQNLSAAIQKLAESERTDNDIKDLRESVGVPEEPEPTADQEAGEERALA